MTVSSTNVGTLLAEAVRQLGARGAGDAAASATLDAELLLAHTLGLPRARLRSHPEAAVDAQRAGQYRDLIGRRAAGESLAYLTGWREFWSLRLAISPAVLVPRPETELLVERSLALIESQDACAADLGTGSGAVALALASERPRWRVIATDISAPALEVARGNADRLGLTRVEFRQGSWFEPLGEERFDLLVSNPPYVAADDPVLLVPPLAQEPRLALTPGPDALRCLRAIARGAARNLSDGGWLLLEHGAGQGAQVRSELVGAGLRYVRSHRDLAGHERMTEGQNGSF